MRPFLFAVILVVVIPFMIPGSLRKVEEAKVISSSPSQTVTVVSKWTKPIGKYRQHWIRFLEPVARPKEMIVTSEEWEAAGPGSRLAIAVLPDGTPHTLNADADVSFERGIVVVEIIALIAAAIYVARTFLRWNRGARLDHG